MLESVGTRVPRESWTGRRETLMGVRKGMGARGPMRGKPGRRGEVARKAKALAMSVVLVLSQALAYVGGVAPSAARAQDVVPDSITVVTSVEYPPGVMNGDGVNSHMFTSSDGTVMYCADSKAGTPKPGETFSGREAGGIYLDYILYYGHGGTEDQGWSQAATQCAVWYELSRQGNGMQTSAFTAKQAASEGRRLYQEALDNASTDAVYSGSTWIYGQVSAARQRVIGQTLRHGSINLLKASGSPSITDGNGCYSLAGAVYEVYDAGMAHVGTLATGADGWSNTLEGLKPGTYYVWERSASQGYGTCDGTDGATWIDGYWYHQVTVRLGQTATVRCSEPAGNDPTFMTIKKVDADSGEQVPQGDADLSGAEFEVRYYATVDPSQIGAGNLTRTWVLKTDSEGYTSLNDAYLNPSVYFSSGDSFYIEGNRATLPYGVVTVQEVSAPKGYTLTDSSVHVITIDSDGAHGDFVSGGVVSDVAEKAVFGGISCGKIDHERDDSVAQGDATLAGAEISITNRSENAVDVDGRQVAPGEVAKVITTDAEGKATTGAHDLPYGTYELTETKAPTGYLLNEGWSETVSVQEDGVVVGVPSVEDDVARGGMSMTKVDHDLMDAYAQGDATLAGAEFELTNDSTGPVKVDGVWYQPGDVVKTIVTDEGGNAGCDGGTLPYGTYTIREVKAPAGYELNASWSQTFEVREPGVVVLLGQNVSDDVTRGGVSVRKVDTEWARSDAQGDATLAGAEFEITNDSAHDVVVDGTRYAAGQVVKTIATGEDGVAATAADALPYGTYSIRETKAPAGYLLNEGWSQTFEVRGQGLVVDLTDDASTVADQVARGDVAVRKVDAELGESLPLGSATLAGAEITVTNDSEHAVRVDGVDYQPGEVVRTLVTDESGAASTTGGTLPYGTYTLRETKAPNGYRLNEGWRKVAYVREDGVTVDVTDAADAVADQAKRGDLRLVKADEDSQARMAGVAFRLTSKTTGESHVLVTDENGMIDTSSDFNSREGGSVNASDAAVSEDGTVDDSKLDPTSGIWFSGRTDRQTTPTDSLGALPYDEYELDELRCAANANHRLVHMGVTVTRDGYMLDLGTVDDKEVLLGTTLTYGADDQKACPADKGVHLVDMVRYENLAANATYKLKGELHAFDEDGNDRGVVATSERELVTEFQADTVPMAFDVDASTLGGMRLVAYEWVMNGDDVLASHANPDDEGQTVRVPVIGTIMSGDLDHEADATAEGPTLTDVVSYRYLEPGREYTVTGTLHYRNAEGDDLGEVKGPDGNAVTGSATVTPESWEGGTVDVTFDLSGVDLSGKTLVAFEAASLGDVTYATHQDATDGGQTVTYPAVATTATSAATGDHDAPAGGEQTIRDEVRLANLVAGRTYKVSGTMHLVAEDGTDAGVAHDASGAESRAEAELVAEGTEQVVTLEFKVATDELAGRDTVAFEELSREGVRLGSHADVTDQPQTVHVPDLHTTLTAGETGAQDFQAPKATTPDVADDVAEAPEGSAEAGEEGTVDNGGTTATGERVTLVDTVAYVNLLPGKEYVVTGTLHARDAEGNDAGPLTDAEGNAVTASTTFTPETADGTVDVTFDVDAGLVPAGTTLVAFEELSREGVTVGTHADIADEGQTVRSIDLATTATDAADGDHEVGKSATAEVVDRVAYTNLKVGQEYAVTGTLHVRDAEGNDAGPLTDAEGNAVTATATFTPETADGTVDVTFDVDLSDVAEGITLVAFEELTREGVTVGTHADIADEGQTVIVTAPVEEYPNTGEAPGALALVGLGTVAVMACVAHVARRRED